MKIANTMEMRLHNTSDIINDIECNPGITNTEIAQRRGLSVPTISNIVNILKNSDMVMTTGTGESSGGRRPIQLSLNPECKYSVGVSIARHTVYLLLINFEGHICDKETYYIQFEESDEYWLEIDNLIKKMQEKVPTPCGVGIALPGFVDFEHGLVLNTHTLGIPTVSLVSIYRVLGEKVSIGDSCRLAAIAQLFSKANIEDNFYILLSRRVSGVLIYDRSVFKLKASSLDIGAMIIDPAKKEATYGTPGSFLDLCSASRIIDILKDNYSVVRYEDFFEEIGNGNQEFAKIWDSYLKNLAIAVYNIYAILKVDIVIGGEMAKYIQPYTQKLEEYIGELSPKNEQNINLHCSSYGEYDDAFGAALETRSLYLQDKLPEILRNAAAVVPAQAKKVKKKKAK